MARCDYSARFYEGAKVTKVNQDFFNANSDFEAMASPDRDTMRARARWLHENNPILSNIDRFLGVNVIGSGIGFQLKTDNESLNIEIEEQWKFAKDNLDITGRDNFDYMCLVAYKNRMMDGEVAFYTPYVKEDFSVNLKLQPIEVDRFALGSFNLNSGQFFDGIETNSYGKPIAYHLQNNLFKNAKLIKQKVSSDVRIPAKNILYYYKRDNRFTQYRGVSEYKQVILDMKNFAAYMRATIESARSRSNVSFIVTTDNLPTSSQFAGGFDKDPIEYINGAFVQYLQAGEKITTLDPNPVGLNFNDFVQNVIRLIAVGRGVSYELAFRDYSGVNYSSARTSQLQDYKLIDAEFAHISKYFYIPIFAKWLEFEALKGSFANLTYAQFVENKIKIINSVKLFSPKREWVDPLKESKAIEIELQNFTTTLEEVCAKRGLDYQEVIAQVAKEKELLEFYGLKSKFDESVDINKLIEEKDE
ncbi:phage portal protein [Campylobacter fetus]|uniref:phage portal protein n=1 Tax=Campylobacter fetus TaxID=196 RepID=UPI0011C73197|nr:phage portal protein [Campylobacter fetus]EAJ1232631.1 phage portal protein [Campylobacter fetus]EAK0414690.1 phage portal protein [Campylobacter fetus]TXF09194.1 phage portal protein [Campylobacter fetus subsp. fetus]